MTKTKPEKITAYEAKNLMLKRKIERMEKKTKPKPSNMPSAAMILPQGIYPRWIAFFNMIRDKHPFGVLPITSNKSV